MRSWNDGGAARHIGAETAAIARRVVWFEEPAEALADPVRFLAHATRHATHAGMRTLRSRYVTDEEFREALDRALPGVVDPRSWWCWNSVTGCWPPPPTAVPRFDG